MDKDTRIAELERRVARLEAFLTADNDEWADPMDLIKKDTLKATIASVVDSEFHISTSAKLERSL